MLEVRRRSRFVVGHARHDALVFVHRAVAALRARRGARVRVRRAYVPTFQAAAGQGQVFVRMLRAVGKIRRAMHRRLFWRPPPEIIPAPPFDRITVRTAKGRIFCPGLVRGRIEEEVS